MNDSITEQELTSLRNAKSESEWNAACDAIKAARAGRYPTDWWPKVQQSGLMAEVMRRW